MKIKFLSICLMIVSLTGSAQNWLTNLNGSSTNAKLGFSGNQALNFYTNNHQWMTLTTAGRFGIGTSDPQALFHVAGKGIISGDFFTGGSVVLQDNLHIETTLATATTPNIFSVKAGAGGNPSFDPYTGGNTFRSLCDVDFPTTQPNEPFLPPSVSHRVAFGPQIANLFSDVIQISDIAQNAVLSTAVMNGDGIIALEPLNGYAGVGGSRALKLNPGCPVNVNICEGGGLTKIFYGAEIRRGLKVFDYGIRTYAQIDGDNALTVLSRESNPLNPDQTFCVYGTGHTEISCRGAGLTGATVLSINEITGNQNLNLINASSGQVATGSVFKVKANGTTEIRADVASGYVVRVKNTGNDIFAVNNSGVVYSREVIVTLNNFPDYVFSNNHKLTPLKEVKKFVESKKCLPNMPTALEVEKQGANIGEIQRVTVEKLEEAYLYIFQLQEKLEQLEKKIQDLEVVKR